MNPARALRTNDTTPPPETSLRMLSQDDPYAMTELVIQVASTVPDWGKVEAYLPAATSFMTPYALDNLHYHMLSAPKACFVFAKDVLENAKRDTLFSCLRTNELNKDLLLFIDTARKTTEASLLSLVSEQFHAQTKTANILHLTGIGHHLLLDVPPADPLDGYEQYQAVDWDGHGAEAITAETLAYARRIMAVMPQTLGTPDVAPAADGTIALEWVPDDTTHKLDKLFLDIGPGEVWRAYWTLRTGEFGRLPQTGFSDETKTILKNLFIDLSA